MISIVIPLYNKAHTIVNTINSVLNQTYQQFEIVIVDDGSTDDGVAVILDNINDNRLRIITQENLGVSAARNNGVSVSHYDYIAFLDGDDLWLPKYLEVMSGAISKFPAAGMFCSAGIVRHSNGLETERLAKKYEGKVLAVNFFENPHVFLHTSATIVQKSQFLLTEGFPLGMKRNQDFAFFFSLALKTEVIYCGFCLSYYIGGVPGQATSAPLNDVIEHVINRYNHIQDNAIAFNGKYRHYRIFMKYELRHLIKGFLMRKDYHIIKYIFDHLNPSITDEFSSLELNIYRKPLLNKVANVFILGTKIRWRMRFYPIVT